MSHIVKVKTRIRNLEYLKKALDSLGMDYELAPRGKSFRLTGFSKNEIIRGCLMKIKTGSAYSIGIRKTEDGYEAAADWWAVETFGGQRKEELLGRITRRYAYEIIAEKARGMGFPFVKEEDDIKANIRISLRKWTSA
jgi:hypothetical protein